ncbi:DNA repair protein XRCC4-like isoform X2 [Salvelinus fontinalis]|uniref:DNA repair protein XRCC4-like isoform X2 n=1 Tax=Salvelinus fontinalis TaxID=8038 RepID=UPI0024855862|nr:DNA repair protein XRCC4-like isoform X2 [Salvelinus fontinalis]
MSGTVRQISVVLDPSIPYFLRVDWAEDLGAGFTLALCDGSSSWIGEVPEEEMMRKATELGVKREKYVEDLHQALTGRGESRRGRGGVAEKEEYLFHLSSDHGCLSYDKKTQRGVLVNMGAVELYPAPVDLNREMIAHTLEHSADLEAENRRLQEKNQTLRQEREHLLADLEKHVQEMETMEGDLFSRFIMLLNEKKAKIRALQDTIRHVQQQLDQGVEEQENHRVTGVTVKSKAGDSIKEEEDLPQSFHPSQAPTVLIRGRTHQHELSR